MCQLTVTACRVTNMLPKPRFILIFVLLLIQAICTHGIIGGANVELIRDTPLDEGSSFRFSVITQSREVLKCQLETPQDGTIVFEPEDQDRSTDKYRIELDSSISACQVTVQDINKNDEGIWTMSLFNTNGTERQVYNVIVKVEDRSESKEEGEEVIEEAVTLLSEINHFVRQATSIDISLNKRDESLSEEECFVRPPNGKLTEAGVLSMANVTVQSSSNYVSCRITIGPMSEDLLGEWRLCGKSKENNEMRCQPATIAWNNDGVSNWDSVQSKFNHSVHFGGSVNPGVEGLGNIITCHVITPNGEDLVIKSDVKYPHIERIAYDNPSLCSFVFSNIDSFMIGDWYIYGKFRSTLFGLNEVHLPLHFFLYNEASPYEQAYNVTVLQETSHLVRLGTSIDMEVRGSGKVEYCRFKRPSGDTIDVDDVKTEGGVTFKSLDTPIACQVAIDGVTEEMIGEWQIVGKFSNGNQFTERQQTFHIVLEDPANPILEEHRVIENMTELIVDTEMGASHRITIDTVSFVQNESCHLLTPNGLQYAFIMGSNIPNVEFIQSREVECGVIVNVRTLDMIGEWTLIARATRLGVPIERRLFFTIRVEETFNIGHAINITEGADLYVRLPNVTNLYDTCKLYGPDNEEITDFEIDPIHTSSCGYIVRGVNHNQNGIWTIVYGNKITYRATVEVNILATQEVSLEDSVWTAGRSVNITVGPEDAVYCRVKDAKGFTVFDGFGSCKIVVDRVTIYHRGYWRIFFGTPGTVLLKEHGFYVEVQEADHNPVTTSVVRNDPEVLLTCSVPIEYEVQACKFRDPRGNILVASHGVGQDGYTFERNAVNYESDAHSHDCTLRLMNPSELDLGLWRCGMDTNQATYFGFLTVICPWLMQDESVAASVVTEPVLKSEREMITSLEGDAVTMSCSIDSAIKYCYFRANNGTVFNVGPTTSSPGYEYVGSGFDAGDCGMRFEGLVAADGGDWSCHVGLVNSTAKEQRASFIVWIREKMSVEHYWRHSSIIVRGTLYDPTPVDYCRFVRIDGLGFTSNNVPSGYYLEPLMHIGICSLLVREPTILDVHPWVVVAKVPELEGEIAKSTIDTLKIPPRVVGMRLSHAIFLWVIVTILMFVLISSSVALIPKKNREWTYARASHLRNSLRSSFRKRPVATARTDFAQNL